MPDAIAFPPLAPDTATARLLSWSWAPPLVSVALTAAKACTATDSSVNPRSSSGPLWRPTRMPRPDTVSDGRSVDGGARQLHEADDHAGDRRAGIDPGVVGLEPDGHVAARQLHALAEAERDGHGAAAVPGDPDGEAAVDRDREVGAGQVVEQPHDAAEQAVEREHRGVERAVVEEDDAVQQLAHRRRADGHVEQVVDLVDGQRDRRRQRGHDLGQRRGHGRRIGLGGAVPSRTTSWTVAWSSSHCAPTRREPSRSSPSSTRRPPGGRGAGEDREHRTELDRSGGDRGRPDHDRQVVEPAGRERERRRGVVDRREAGGVDLDPDAEGVRLPPQHDRAGRELERLAVGLHVDAGGQRVLERRAQRGQRAGQPRRGRGLEGGHRIGRERGEPLVGELRRGVPEGEEVADLGHQRADGPAERRSGLRGEGVEEERQRVVGGVDGSRRGRGGQPRPGRVEGDVGTGLRAEEHPEAAVQRGVDRLAAGGGAVHAQVEVEREARRSRRRDAHGRVEARGQPAQRCRSRRRELRRVDRDPQLERSAGIVARERDAGREDQLAGLPGQPEERLERVEQRDEAGRLPAHGAGVAQPAGRVVEEAGRQPHRRLRRVVEEAEGAEGGVDDRLGRRVGAAQHLERGLAEERGGQCEQDVDGGRGVQVGPQREIAGRRRPGRAPPQHRPGRDRARATPRRPVSGRGRCPAGATTWYRPG